MASRRTRIKGIANIPQRRKTLNASSTETAIDANLELGEKGQKEDDEQTLLETLSSPRADVIDVIDAISKENHEKNSEQKCDAANEISPACDNENKTDKVEKCDEESGEQIKDEQPQPMKTTLRRKFVKPVVFLKGIRRKAKDDQSKAEQKSDNIVNLSQFVCHTNQPLEQQNESNENDHSSLLEIQTSPVTPDHVEDDSSKTIRNNKIVVLDQTICWRNQQEVNIVASEDTNILRAPEIIIPSTMPQDNGFKGIVPHSPQLLTPEMEYPIPPPSPNKMNRSRIKAVPRLGQRNTSFSASESEDESRRNYRHRNDSVCSTASGLQDSNSLPECLSPQKPKDFNSIIQRKCRRTEQSRKLAEARRDFQLKFGNKKPDRQKLTMIDLIFYNPVTNLMSDTKTRRKISESESGTAEENETVDDPGVGDQTQANSASDEENEIPAPQIKIGPQGEIVVDEQSLVVENKAVKKSREEIEKSAVVNADFDTGYGVYKRAKRSKDWSKQETLKFYKALNTIGTDFTIMCELFPRRSRRELKMKFKKEERVNKILIDRAIMQPCNFDFSEFKHEVDMEEKELQEIEKQKERERQMKIEAKKRKSSVSYKSEPPEKSLKMEVRPKVKKKRALDIMDVLESDADESEIESLEGDASQDKLIQAMQKPTRSGRVPKVVDKYKAVETETKNANPKPGSLIVAAETGENGQPIYRVCMVTPENGRQQIGENMTSLEEALQCSESSATQSLLTISISTTDMQNEPPVENNITISEEESPTEPAS